MCDEEMIEEVYIEELCNEYFLDIYNYCLKLIHGQRDLLSFAEDCTQNTFLEAHKQISILKSHPNVKGWLFCTAKNMINNSFRCMYLQRKREIYINDAVLTAELHYIDPNLENISEGNINIDKLSKYILGHLHSFEYEIYYDYYKNKMSISKLSVKYQMTESAITTRIYRIKKNSESGLCLLKRIKGNREIKKD
ncbi:RNA polymerase factor sigma C [compost metagenome]